jgi:predicted metalloprotease
MELDGSRESSNVEDVGGSGGGGRTMVFRGGLGTVVLALVAMYFGVDPRVILGGASAPAPPAQTQQQPEAQRPADPSRNKEKKFISRVLASTEDTWNRLLPHRYHDPKLLLFSGQVQSACGMASTAVGPFYCGEDQQVYLDLSFFHQLSQQLGAPGDFAQAYVVAHEVGHHVQNVLGTLGKVQAQERQGDGRQQHALSVRLELQADFYAGVWAHYAQAQGLLDPGDMQQGLTAAAAVGDDRLQKRSQGYVVPDSFTHGTSEQRMRWFKRGFDTGDIRQGDTFNADPL